MQSLFANISEKGSIEEINPRYDYNTADAMWVLLNAFVVFSMQIGFGLYESGIVQRKNQTSIIFKCCVDTIFAGIAFWTFGFGFSYGNDWGTNPFTGIGQFFLSPNPSTDPEMGGKLVIFFYYLTFSSTATTIVGGAMAERINFIPYAIYAYFNTLTFSISTSWAWGDEGFLRSYGFIDISGNSTVHLLGGISAAVAAYFIGPRTGRYAETKKTPPAGDPGKALHGLMILWFTWLSLNCSSTFAVTGENWKFAARAATVTTLASFGGGFVSLVYSLIMNKGKIEPIDFINGTLGSLVATTGGCFLFQTWSAYIIGGVGALLTLLAVPLLDKLKIDDPVGAFAIHGVSGWWGVIAVGLFAEKVTIPLKESASAQDGLFMGGGFYLLGVQALGALCYTVWAILCTFVLLFLIDKFLRLRMTADHEAVGADLSEHNISPEKSPSCTCKCREIERILNDLSMNNSTLRHNLTRYGSMSIETPKL